MRISDLESLGFNRITDGEGELKRGYTCDLLSEVMAKAETDTVWFTVQSHVNVIAVAAITGIRAIVLCNGHKFDEEAIEKAKDEKISLFTTPLNAFEAGGKLYNKGLR